MKTTLRITKLELNNLFFSPIAWIILIGFSIYVGVTMVPTIAKQALEQALYNSEFDFGGFGFAAAVFAGMPRSLFTVASSVIMILVPLMTMGLISRETGSGSIKLLYSSPIKLRSIVLGKYLAAMCFVSMLMLILLVALIVGQLTIENFDFLGMFSGFIGLFLLSATVTAISLYVSTFTSYPVIDAVITISLVYGASVIYGLVREIPIVSDIFYWLVPETQTESLVNGLMMSKNVGYFLVVMAMFLFLAYFKMELKRQTRADKSKTRLKMSGTVLVSMAVIYLITRPSFTIHKDMTSNQRNVLAPVSKEKLAPLKGQPITITKYSNVVYGGDPSLRGQLFEREQMFSKFLLELPQIAFEYKFYYTEAAIEELSARGVYGLSPDMSLKEALDTLSYRSGLPTTEMIPRNELPVEPSAIDQYGSLRRGFFEFRSGDRKAYISAQIEGIPQTPNEQEVVSTMMALIEDKVQFAVVTGHGERSFFDSSNPGNITRNTTNVTGRPTFINNGVDVQPIRLTEEVPGNVDILAIADPQSPYSTQELDNFKKFVDQGGNVLLLSEPGKNELINPLMNYVGIEQLPGQVATDDPDVNSHFVYGRVDTYFGELLEVLGKVIFMPDAAALKVSDDNNKEFTYTTFIASKEEMTWLDEQVTSRSGSSMPFFSGNRGMMRQGGTPPQGRRSGTPPASGQRPSMGSGVPPSGSSRPTMGSGTPPSGGSRPAMRGTPPTGGRPPQGMPMMGMGGQGANPMMAQPQENVTFDPANGDKKEKLTLAMLLERKVGDKEQRIIVSGDTDFLSDERNVFLAPGNVNVSNGRIGMPMLKFLTNDVLPLDISIPDTEDKRTSIPFESLWLLKLFMYFILPGTFAFLGARMLVKRMRS